MWSPLLTGACHSVLWFTNLKRRSGGARGISTRLKLIAQQFSCLYKKKKNAKEVERNVWFHWLCVKQAWLVQGELSDFTLLLSGTFLEPARGPVPRGYLKHKEAFYSRRYDFFFSPCSPSALFAFPVHISESEINLVNHDGLRRWQTPGAFKELAKLVSWLITYCLHYGLRSGTNNILIIATQTETLLTVKDGKHDKGQHPGDGLVLIITRTYFSVNIIKFGWTRDH